MEKKRPLLIASEENTRLPVLIIDKKGFIGEKLADRLKEQFLVVLVSGKPSAYHRNIIHIPYKRKVPVIPDNSYSHIFVLYSGESEMLEILPPLVRKAHASSGKAFLITSLHNSSPELFRKLSHHTYHSLRVILYGEIFDNELTYGNMVNYFIHQVRKSNRIEIPGEGLGKLYPVYLEDVLVAIIAAAFSHETKNHHIFVFPKVPFTEMSVARMFQRIDPEIKIDFSEKKVRSFSYFIPENGYHVFSKYTPEEGLRKIDLSDSEKTSAVSEKSIKPRVERWNINYRFIMIATLALLLLPLLVILLFAGVGALLLSQSVRDAEGGRFQRAAIYAGVGQHMFSAAEVIGANYVPGAIFASEHNDAMVYSLATGRQVSDVAGDFFSSLNSYERLYRYPNDTQAEENFVKAIGDIKNSLIQLEEMKAQKQLPASMEQKMNDANFMLNIFENTVDYLPKILGFEKKQKYLLLFQNNMELRPGGGFIGSYGIVSVEHGRFSKIDIHDVYDADGKLKTHVEPPYALRRYAGVSHAFLRDSNFGVDYTANALSSMDILRRATGDDVDGVVAIDTNFIKNLLEVLGPVSVDEFNETVTAENFYMLTQKHVEENFFPGSTQKKDFLRALLSAMLEKSDENRPSYVAFAKALEKSVKEKHLMISFRDETTNNVFSINGLSGALLDNRVEKENTINDFFATFDANIGATKGNYYLKRSISQTVIISDAGQVQEEATITFENTSKKDSKFGGTYKNYLRFVLPRGANLQSVKIDGRNTPIVEAFTNPTIYTDDDFVAPSELEIESLQVNGKELVGFFVEIPPLSTKSVSILYTLAQSVNSSSPTFAYNLRLFKQPGTIEDPYKLTLLYPSKVKPFEIEKSLIDLGGKVVYESLLSEDKDIAIEFVHK
jgi:hypothetical protein